MCDADPEMGAPTAESRGLMLIGHIARAWGVRPEPGARQDGVGGDRPALVLGADRADPFQQAFDDARRRW